MEKTKEYFEFKQYLLKRAGVKTILVPDDQIEPIPDEIWKNMREILERNSNSLIGDAELCPYCIMHNYGIDNNCKNCIMSKKGNRCNNDNSTYKKVLKELCGKSISSINNIEKELLYFLRREKYGEL